MYIYFVSILSFFYTIKFNIIYKKRLNYMIHQTEDLLFQKKLRTILLMLMRIHLIKMELIILLLKIQIMLNRKM